MKGRLFIGLLWTILACTAPVEEEAFSYQDCKYNAPTPIFSIQQPYVNSHGFKEEDGKKTAHERVEFENGLELYLVQSGCNEIKQNFQFKLYGEFPDYDAAVWLQQAGNFFIYIGTLDEELYPFYQWGDVILNNRNEMELNTTYQLQEGITIKIERKKFQDYALLSVSLAMM